MSLKTIVKVSHLSNLSDARYCAGMGVDLLGIGVVPSTANHMAPELFQEIRGWLAGPRIVAELYGFSNREEVLAVDAYAPDLVELTLGEYQKFGALLKLPCIIRLDGAAPADELRHSTSISYFIADESASCDDVPGPVPILVQVTSLKSVHEKLAQKCFSGVVLEGPAKTHPGITNYDQLGDLLEALEE